MRNAKPFIVTLFTLLILLPGLAASAQYYKQTKVDSTLIHGAHTVFVELGGPGLFFSANYDTRFSGTQDGLGGRIGLGYYELSGVSFFSVPVQLNYLLGKNGKYFEIGAGASYVSFNDNNSYNNNNAFLSFDNSPVSGSTVIGTMTFGYRYQPVEGGFSFRASFNPLFNSSNFQPFVGISFGYAFGKLK